MRPRRGVLWALIDVLGTSLGVMLWSVHPVAKTQEGEKKDALFLITADWPVDRDADVDLWLQKPDGTNVFFSRRDVGCAKLDNDNRGFLDGQVKLSDGSTTTVISNKETISLRCIEPGRYTVGVNLYNYHHDGRVQDPERPVQVRVQIEALNPSITTVYAQDTLLDTIQQTRNMTSFDLAADGKVTLAEPPLEPVTASTFRHGAANQAIP